MLSVFNFASYRLFQPILGQTHPFFVMSLDLLHIFLPENTSRSFICYTFMPDLYYVTVPKAGTHLKQCEVYAQ